VTDPPYLVDHKARNGRAFPNDRGDGWLAPAFREMHRLLKRAAFLVSFYGWFKRLCAATRLVRSLNFSRQSRDDLPVFLFCKRPEGLRPETSF
jgi:hypothetical protein